MIDLLKLSRKNITNMWAILGDKWNYVKHNKFSNNLLEGFWCANEFLANGRTNYLLNLEDRIANLSIYGYIDFITIEDLKNSFKKGNDKRYPFEYKIYYEKLYQYKNIKVNYLYPPNIFTNTLLPAKYAGGLYNGYIIEVNVKDGYIKIADDLNFADMNFKFYNYVFVDDNDNPFIIKNIINNKIFYKQLIDKTSPIVGEINIQNKFELSNNEDYICIPNRNYLLIKFKEFDYLADTYSNQTKLSEESISIFSPNCYVLDNFNINQFGKPIGLTDNSYENLKQTDTLPEVESKIFKLWKVNQRPYNFQQPFRIGAIIADQSYASTINGEEVIFDIDLPNKKVYTSKLESEVYGRIVRFKDVPTNLQSIFSYNGINTETYSIVILTGDYNNLGFTKSNLIFIDGIVYKIKKIFDSQYFEVDKEVMPGTFQRKIQILSSNFIKIYNLNPDTIDSNSDVTYNVIPFRTVAWGQKTWESFVWGEIYGKKVYTKCEFKIPEIGKKYLFGDPFVQTLQVDYFENSVFPDFVQKQLALDNKNFSQSNVEEYTKAKSLVLLPYLNNSNFNRNTYLELLANESLDLITTEDKESIIVKDFGIWYNSPGVTSKEITSTSYNLKYVRMNFETKGGIFGLQVDSKTNNRTKNGMLSFYLRVNSGSVKIGLSDNESYLTAANFKNIFYNKSNWIHKRIFINIDELDINKIIIESYDDSTEIDIFGIEFITSIPEFSEKLYNNKNIFNEFMYSNDYKLINLL